MCGVCQKSREIDLIKDIYDPLGHSMEPTVEDLNSQNYFERCFYQVKFKLASNWHNIWIPYLKIFESTKFKPFQKRLALQADELLDDTAG